MKNFDGLFYGLALILVCVVAAGIAAHVRVGHNENCFNSRCNWQHCDCVNCICGKGERR